MCAVAKGLLAAVLTAAEEDPLAGLGRVFDGCDAGVFVAAVAKWLFAALAAGAPEIAFARLNFDWVGRFLRDNRCRHGFCPRLFDWSSPR